MPAYNFKGQFADAVQAGTKPHTIRPRREHPTKVGDVLYLYSGMRTRDCRRLRVATCTKVTPIIITADFNVRLGDRKLSALECALLSERDGFPGPLEFFVFFADTYGPRFAGELIEWDPLQPQPSTSTGARPRASRALGADAQASAASESPSSPSHF